jgi:hypothetical protein
MPEPYDFQAIVDGVHAVDDAIRTKNNLPQMWAQKLGDDPATLRKSRQGPGRIEQLIPHPLGGYNIIESDIGDDPFQIVQGVGEEEDFEVRWGIRLRASSRGMRSPRSSETNPSSTA